ncbi:hypothetical protein NPIL_128311 [Nephila pilipes]|uniref:Uncharacterized protein n=1 Tax=Nephila pilipes TaxID=299642 RepID=A0A8X6QAW5_NEPPI|nr:hypothetical protein NPIL_128311 [Nephila pilipes]
MIFGTHTCRKYFSATLLTSVQTLSLSDMLTSVPEANVRSLRFGGMFAQCWIQELEIVLSKALDSHEEYV